MKILADLPEPGKGLPRLVPYAVAVLVVGACTAVNWLLYQRMDLANVVMVYLLGVLLLSYFLGTLPSIAASVMSVLAFDVFFVPPRFTLAVSSVQHVFTFGVMLLVALSISHLTSYVRFQVKTARARERRTASLYSLSRELAGNRGTDPLLQVAIRHISENFDSAVVALLPEGGGKLTVRVGEAAEFNLTPRELALAQWSNDFGQIAGRGTSVVPDAEALYVPLPASGETIGALAIKPRQQDRMFTAEQMNLIESIANQAALAVASDRLTEENRGLEQKEENERIRSSLLSSISHDFRTPLAAITGSASALLKDGAALDEGKRRDLLENIRDQADHLGRLVGNLLEMTRLEAGPVELHKEPNHIQEVVGSAVARMVERIGKRHVAMAIPPELSMVPMDPLLVEQVLVNLIDNCLKYTPADSPIELTAAVENGQMTVRISDRGPGIASEDLDRLFDKFYRGSLHGSSGGAGLGLAICKAVVEAHGGAIWASNRPGGGAVFQFTIPAAESATKDGARA